MPVAGRRMTTVLPPSVQDDVATVYVPIAATFKLTFPAAPEPPLVLNSTTTMSFPAAEGALGVRGIESGPEPGASTTNVTVFESVPSGFCTCTARFPADCRSAAASDVVHSALDTQEVVREAPVTKIVEPGPGLDAMKLLPDISSVKPPADPAYALDGARDEMFGPLEMVTLAVPDWLVSSELVATMLIRLGEGAECGATYSPEESIDPHAPELPHPAPGDVPRHLLIIRARYRSR